MAWKPTAAQRCAASATNGLARRQHRHRDGQAPATTAGTFTSRRTARAEATSCAVGRSVGADRDTVGHLVEQWAAGRVDVSSKARLPRSSVSCVEARRL